MTSYIGLINSQWPNLKQRFLQAVENGELGTVNERGIIVTAKEFKECFADIKSQYVGSFLPAATIEPGRTYITNTKFVFRLRKGVYLLHPEAIKSE